MTSIEWFIDRLSKVIYNPLETDGYSKAIEKLYAQAIEMHKQEMKKCYEHGSFALLDTGHGDTFEQYYQETFKTD